MLKKLKISAFLMALMLVLAACGGSSDTEEASTTPENGDSDATTEEVSTEGGDLIVAVLSDASILDPNLSSDVPSGNIQSSIYETLLKFNLDMELEPLLATDWEAVDERTWEFTLREGVKFHDGTDFNAEVVKANIERVLDPELSSPRAMLYEMIEEIIIVDDYTIQLVTDAPFAPLPAHFAHYASSIVSLDAIEKDYEQVANGGQFGAYINENPIGTNAFVFESWTPGDNIVLTRNENYWGENAKVDTVTFRVVPEDLTRLAELETGNAHIIDPVQASDLARIEATDGISAYSRDRATITYLGFNVTKEPFDDVRVRQAIAKVLDRDVMIDGILYGHGEAAVGPVNDTQFGFSPDVETLAYNPERAKELLAEAGYPDGFDTTIWTNDNRERIDIAELTQAELANIGINAEIRVVEWGAYLEATAAGEQDMYILGLSLGTMDTDYPMHMLFHTSSIGNGNRSHYSDETFDAMLHEARIEQDEDTRLQMYIEATNYLNEQVPAAFLYHPLVNMGVRDEVKGFWSDASSIYQLKDVYIEQ